MLRFPCPQTSSRKRSRITSYNVCYTKLLRFNQFVGRCVTTLGDKVLEVRASKVLKNSPVRLVSPADAQNREMDRIQRLLNQDYEVPKRILEVNRNHPLVAHLTHLVANQPESDLTLIPEG